MSKNIKTIDTWQFEENGVNFSKALVDVCFNAHGEVVEVRVRSKSAPGARWSRMWRPVGQRTREVF